MAIDFTLINKDVMINATEMAKLFGKLPANFLNTEQTQEYINTACRDEFFSVLFPFQDCYNNLETKVQDGNPHLETEVRDEDIRFETRKKMIVNTVHGGRKNGTWMHRQLALKFAAWLSPAFEIWVWHTIDQILFGYYREAQKIEVQLDQKEIKIEQLHKKLLDNADYVEREELLRDLKDAKRFRNALGSKQLNLFREYAKPKMN